MFYRLVSWLSTNIALLLEARSWLYRVKVIRVVSSKVVPSKVVPSKAASSTEAIPIAEVIVAPTVAQATASGSTIASKGIVNLELLFGSVITLDIVVLLVRMELLLL